MNDRKLDESAAWKRLLELLRAAPPELAATLRRQRSRHLARMANVEQIVGAISWGDIVHLWFGPADDEGNVEEGSDIAWCAVQADDQSGYWLRIDIPESGVDDQNVHLLAAVVLDRPTAEHPIGRGPVMLAYTDAELATLAADVAALVSQFEMLEADEQIDGSIWEVDEQPDDFPSIRELPYAASMYAD